MPRKVALETEEKNINKKTKTPAKKSSKTVVSSTTSSKKVKSTKKTLNTEEYYDLPYRYNQTLVKILAQTPKTLFIYWDISDKDRKNFTKNFGENFFNKTKPVLIVKNETTGKTFETEINDYANSWYLYVEDTKCKFTIELGRRATVAQTELSVPTPDYIYVAHSNIIETPNNRILSDKSQKMIYFMNVKNNTRTEKSVASLNFMNNMGKVYNIYSQMEADDIQKNPSSNSFNEKYI